MFSSPETANRLSGAGLFAKYRPERHPCPHRRVGRPDPWRLERLTAALRYAPGRQTTDYPLHAVSR